MATFNVIRSLVLTAFGRDDADAILIAEAAINYAVKIASLTFNPPEMSKESAITLGSGLNEISIPAIVGVPDLSLRLLDIIKVYNTTDGFKIGFIPYELWDLIVPSDLEDVKFWTLFGTTLKFKGTPTENTDLKIGYTFYPTMLSGTDPLPFDKLDDYIISVTTAICFAAFEEDEAASLWTKIASLVGTPATLGTKAQSVIEMQKTILENTIAQVRGT